MSYITNCGICGFRHEGPCTVIPEACGFCGRDFPPADLFRVRGTSHIFCEDCRGNIGSKAVVDSLIPDR